MKKEIRVLSRITINENVIIKNQSFSNIEINDLEKLGNIINKLKTNYEDYWKDINQINTSIKLTLTIKAQNLDNNKITNFEKILSETDQIYNLNISKFDKDYTFYRIIYNGTPDSFKFNEFK